MSQKTPALEIHNLSVVYNESPVLLNVSCSVPQGVLCAFIGPNGAGKTTILKSVLGLVHPLAGVIRVLGEPYKAIASRVAYVPQRTSVDWDFPATVFDVVMMGRYQHIGWFWRPGKSDIEKVWSALAHVDMSTFANQPISQLSGGQQQRVFLARALVQEADLYFMDEPFSGVDMATEQAIIALLKTMRSQGKTVIVVHHDLQTVHSYFDWAVLLNRSTIACGPIASVVTEKQIHATYGRSDICIPSITKEMQR